MDEPFGPLDAQTRLVMQQELLDLWARKRKTILFVTHDLAEAITLSDQVVVMIDDRARSKASLTFHWRARATSLPFTRVRNSMRSIEESGTPSVTKFAVR